MPITKLYHSWMDKLTQLLPNERITRVRNLAWLLAGIFESKSVHLSTVANKIPRTAMLVSVTRRLDRFLESAEFRVRDWYEPIVKGLLAQRAGQEYRLIVDGSKVGFDHQFLLATLAFRRRAIPLVWMWVRSSRGHSTAGRQLALLGYIYHLLLTDALVLVLGDSESVFKLHRLTFAVVLLFLELVASGSKIIKQGLRKLVDRSDRRDLSIFRFSLYKRERHLANDVNFRLDFYPVL